MTVSTESSRTVLVGTRQTLERRGGPALRRRLGGLTGVLPLTPGPPRRPRHHGQRSRPRSALRKFCPHSGLWESPLSPQGSPNVSQNLPELLLRPGSRRRPPGHGAAGSASPALLPARVAESAIRVSQLGFRLRPENPISGAASSFPRCLRDGSACRSCDVLPLGADGGGQAPRRRVSRCAHRGPEVFHHMAPDLYLMCSVFHYYYYYFFVNLVADY